MFEESLKSPQDRAREPDLTLSADRRSAWRAAAVILVCNVLLGAGLAFATHSGGQGIAWIIALVLAYKLYHLRTGTDTIVAILAALGGVLGPILYIRHGFNLDAALLTVANLAFVGALLLLLLGEPRRARRLVAACLFCGLTVPIAALEIVAGLVIER
jgi:hypothetical protein